MKSKVILTALLLLLGLNTVAGQTAEEIETKYGKPENVYSVSEHIWMTPAYAADGHVCMMRLYPKLISSDTNYLDAKLETNEVLETIDQLVPGSTRGARIGFFGMSVTGGGVVWTHFNYDRVHFTFVSSFKLDKLPDQEPETLVGQDSILVA